MNFKKPNINEEDSKIDEMKDFLYSRSTGNIKPQRSVLKKRKKTIIQNNWAVNKKDENTTNDDVYKYKIKKKRSMFYFFLLFSFIFFIGALVFSVYFLMLNKNEISLQEIDISVIGPNSIKSGEDLSFSVIVENMSDLTYEDIDMTVYFPDSTVKSSDREFVKADSREIKKDLLPNSKIKEQFDVALSGSVGEKKDMKIDIFYKGKSYSGFLNKQTTYTVQIDSAPVDIQLEYPKKIISSDEFNMKINILSNVTEPINDLLVVGKYPVGFEVVSTKPESIFTDTKNVFSIETINPGDTETIAIKGFLRGEEGEEKYFNFIVGDTLPFKNEMRTVFAKQEDRVLLKEPDMSFVVESKNENNNEYDVYSAGGEPIINFNLKNNLSDIVSNVKITADIEGAIYDKKSVKTSKGFFDSNKDRLVWDRTINDAFKSLSSEQFVTDKIAFDILSYDEIISDGIKNPEINFKFKIFGTSFADAGSQNEIYLTLDKKIKLRTKLDFSEQILYSQGPFKNTGDVNPVSGEKTTYTVAWSIKNTTSDIEDLQVKAKLPIYIKYLNNTSPKNAYFSYNEETREVTLNYKKIDAFTGYNTDVKTAYFQIEYLPTDPHIGSEPVIVEQKYITASDSFTGENIKIENKVSTTKLRDDPEYDVSGLVQEK